MRVTLFARVDTALNPYMLLLKQSLESQGLVVYLEPEFNLAWLITKGKSCDAVHIHWIEAAYKPVQRNIQSAIVNKLIDNRFVNVLRGALRLANFSVALFLAKLQGKIVVYTVHNLKTRFSEQHFSPLIILGRIAHRIVLLLSDQIHVHNQYTRNEIEANYHRKHDVRVIPHGNYIGCYPNQISQFEARRQLDLPDDAFVYLFLGLLRPYKGVEDLIGAFKKLDGSSGRLLIAGQIFKAGYQAKISSLIGNNPAIKLVPEFVPNETIQLYMNACNVCVLPYKEATTSGAALLALSFGRPFIAPAIGPFPELTVPEIGLLYTPSQPNALVWTLQQAQQRNWSEATIFDYAHQFDWDKLGSQLVKLYRLETGNKRLAVKTPRHEGR